MSAASLVAWLCAHAGPLLVLSLLPTLAVALLAVWRDLIPQLRRGVKPPPCRVYQWCKCCGNWYALDPLDTNATCGCRDDC